MAPISAVVIGAGQRGRHVYGRWALDHPDEMRIVAVVDPDPNRRAVFADEHGISQDHRFDNLEGLTLDIDAAIIATPDRAHHSAAVWAMDAGLHTLLEKPMAATLEDSLDLVDRAAASKGTVHVGHVLRHTPFFQTVHQIVTSGRLGDIVTVEHRENVASSHMAHSFVRGNWSRLERSAPMIVQKCCHDFDILTWNLASPVRRLASIGNLKHFHPDQAPPGATQRCTDGCPATDCPFDARRIYLDPDNDGWPVHVITDDLSMAARIEALASGPYGRCVYHAGSDVVDHQVVTMELESGTSVTLTMHGHSHREQRTMRYDGTHATLRAATGHPARLTITDHLGGPAEEIPLPNPIGGHGGGDDGIIRSFVASVHSGAPGPTDISIARESHLVAFLAEEARLSGTYIDVASRR